MTAPKYVPVSTANARRSLKRLLATKDLSILSSKVFAAGWSALAYLNPELHPDSIDEVGGGWSPELRRIGEEALRRNACGEMSDNDFYPSDAQWAGLYDQLTVTTKEEDKRRRSLAA